ncbi:MAG: hypothetical protein ACREBU_25125 [Nitrososphaera sp.]
MYTNKKYTGLLAIAMAVTISTVFAQTASAAEEHTTVRAFQNGVLLDGDPGQIGTDTDCVGGIHSDEGAVSMTCYLIPPGVANNDNTNAIAQLSTGVNVACPADAGFDLADDECFSVTFDGSLFDQQGDWHFHAEFYNATQGLIADGKQTFANNSFFVLPESPIGVAALVVSSLAVLGGFMFLRRRNHSQLPI